MSALFARELDLPPRGRSMRVTRRPTLQPGETFVLFDEEGPGCILHWWLTHTRPGPDFELDPGHYLRLRLYYDGAEEPTVDLTLAQFFGVLMESDLYEMDSAAIRILPRNAYNCYLPIPFRSLRVELENRSENRMDAWFMGDWQRYDDAAALTDMRLHADHARENPADPSGSFLMADLTGRGFVAGMVHGAYTLDLSDSWYHSGGDLWLLDGESDPHALRGIGGEDIFNQSFGIHPRMTQWVGVPLKRNPGEDAPAGAAGDGVMYRFFGPDPIWFEHSAVSRFGSKANHLESVIYSYLDAADALDVLTVPEWRLAGPFPCATPEDFARREWADSDAGDWPRRQVADFGMYVRDGAPAEFSVPLHATTEHAWCDLARHYRGRQRANFGTQPAAASAYAVGTLAVPEGGRYVLRVGYDDWLKLWVDGELLQESRRDDGFGVDELAADLSAGEHEVRVKLSNFDNAQWRLWAFSLSAERE